jgi:hypothetical protein
MAMPRFEFSDRQLFVEIANQRDLTPTNLIHGSSMHTCLKLRRIRLTHEACEVMRSLKSSWSMVRLEAVIGEVEEAIQIFLAQDSSIEHLSFGSMSRIMNLDAWRSLGKGLQLTTSSNLHSLVLNYMDIPIDFGHYLGEALRINQSLQYIGLFFVNWMPSPAAGAAGEDEDTSGLDIEFAISLSRGLSENRHLLELDLVGCYLSDTSASKIVRSLRMHPAMQKLGLSSNRCGQETSVALAELLREPTTALVELYLNNQARPTSRRCRDVGTDTPLNISVLASALRDNRSLRVLDLTDLHLGDEEVDSLMSALSAVPESAYNKSLEKLFLARNAITHSGFMTLMYQSIPRLRGLRTLSLGGNLMENISSNGEKTVNSNTQHLLKNRAIKAMVELEDVELLKTVAAPEQVPMALWPYILQRLQEIYPKARSSEKTSTAMVDMLYFIVHGPMLSPLSR